jgi:hypothetical protein
LTSALDRYRSVVNVAAEFERSETRAQTVEERVIEEMERSIAEARRFIDALA